jgi:tellurite resistance protein TerC
MPAVTCVMWGRGMERLDIVILVLLAVVGLVLGVMAWMMRPPSASAGVPMFPPMVVYAAQLGYRTARRVVIVVVGGTVMLLGVVMIVTPGPGLLAIFLGLAILATEFVWARRLLSLSRQGLGQVQARTSRWWRSRGGPGRGGPPAGAEPGREPEKD